MSTLPDPDIQLYTSGTPNGQKISCTLEELGIGYTVHDIEISKNVQKEPWFLDINPNGRIPAIVDKTGGLHKRVFEGAAIQLYLTERYDEANKISFTYNTDEYWEMVEWLVWMQSGIGPMQGQANHFYRYAPEKIEYAIKRYQTETKRLYGILNDRLSQQRELHNAKQPYLVANKYCIADLACFSWVNWAAWAGVATDPFSELQQWLEAIEQRPAVQRGLDVPKKFEMKEAMKTREGEEAFAKHHSNWVMQNQNTDQEKHK